MNHPTSIADHRLEASTLLGIASMLLDEGRAYNDLGLYEEAIEKYAAALAIFHVTGNRKSEAATLVHLGNAWENLGKYHDAIQDHTAALSIAEEIEDQPLKGIIMIGLGNCYYGVGLFEKAIGMHRSSLAIKREIGDKDGEMKSLANLGIDYDRLGQYHKAIECHTAAVVIAQELADRRREGRCLGYMGIAYQGLGQYDKALEMHTASHEIAHEVGDQREVGVQLSNLALAHDGLGKHDEGAGYQIGALAIARELGNREREGTCLGNLGNNYRRRGMYDRALEHYKEALDISREIGDRQREAAQLGNLGITYERLEDHDKATQCLKESISLYDKIWSDIQNDEHRITYDDGAVQLAIWSLQRVYTTQGKHEDALKCAERARSRSFELLLAQQRVQGGSSSDDSLASQPSAATLDFSRMRDVAVSQRSAIIYFSQVASNNILAWVVESKKCQPLFFQSIHIQSEEDPLSRLCELVEITRRSLRAPSRQGSDARCAEAGDSMLLATSLVSDEVIYAATAKKIVLPDGGSPTADDVRNAFTTGFDEEGGIDNRGGCGDHVMDSCQVTDLQGMASKILLRRCHELFIEPLLPALANETRLIIIPDRDFYALPFAALLSNEGKHLIEEYQLRIAPSVGTLTELEKRINIREPQDDGLSALVVGDPDLSYASLDPLPHARKEAQEISQIMKSAQCILTHLEGDAATKDRVKSEMKSSNIVHLATHGLKDAIFLSGATEEEGKLHMAEVQQLRLERASLVVLSACDSFKGELRADGVIGISRAFVSAGAPTLLSTLWQVNDHTTQLVMNFFYRRLFSGIDGVTDVASALQDAMVSMIRHGYEIYNWAPFVVYGISASAADIGSWVCLNAKPILHVELEDLLACCRVPKHMLNDASSWCEENRIESVRQILLLHKEVEFADSLQLTQVRRKLLLRRMKKIAVNVGVC